MPDSAGRKGCPVTISAFMGKSDHDELISAIRERPNIVREFMEVVFPELSEKYLEGAEPLGDVMYIDHDTLPYMFRK